MNLVNEQNYISCTLNLLNKTLDAAFKLTAELGPCDKPRKVEEVDFLIKQSGGRVAVCYFKRQALGYGGFTDARLAYKAGVVFGAAGENLDSPVKLLFPADYNVNLSVSRLFGEVCAILLHKTAAFFLRFFIPAVLNVGFIFFLLFGIACTRKTT